MPLDPEIADLVEADRRLPPRESLTVEQTRERMRGAVTGARPPLARVVDVQVNGVPVRDYWPTLDELLPAVVFFHGGRFFSGDLDTHDVLCGRLAVSGGCRVMAVDYRLAPEHRFPAAVEDACRVVASVLQAGGRIGVAGDSAGGNLAAVAAQCFRKLRCQLLIYPMIDATCTSASYREFASGYGPGAVDMARGWREYLPDGQDLRDSLVSPLFAADLAGAPPALVLTAEYDTLRDEGESYAGRLREAGVDVTLSRYEGAIHGFLMADRLSLASRALAECGGFLRARL